MVESRKLRATPQRRSGGVSHHHCSRVHNFRPDTSTTFFLANPSWEADIQKLRNACKSAGTGTFHQRREELHGNKSHFEIASVYFGIDSPGQPVNNFTSRILKSSSNATRSWGLKNKWQRCNRVGGANLKPRYWKIKAGCTTYSSRLWKLKTGSNFLVGRFQPVQRNRGICWHVGDTVYPISSQLYLTGPIYAKLSRNQRSQTDVKVVRTEFYPSLMIRVGRLPCI